MSLTHFEYIWKFLRENNRDGFDNITDEMICCICQRILIDSCIASCGCRYCLACITKYLDRKQRFCPGNEYDCKKVLLNICDLGYPDYIYNQKISKLIVKCPQNLCEFRGELRNMEEHHRVCNIQTMSCPYGFIGRQERQLTNNEIVVRDVSHTKLLMECMDMLQNEMVSMKSDFAEHQEVVKQQSGEIKSLNLKIRSLNFVIGSIRTNNKSIKEDNISIKAENESIKIDNKLIKWENNFLKSELARMRTDYSDQFEQMNQQFSDVQVRVQAQTREIWQIRNKSRWNETRVRELERTNCKGIPTRRGYERRIDNGAVPQACQWGPDGPFKRVAVVLLWVLQIAVELASLYLHRMAFIVLLIL